MLRFIADENFNNAILRGIHRRNGEIDIVRVQDAGLAEADDRTILAWSAKEGCVLLTHDVRTMTRFAYERVENGQPMPGVFEVPCTLPVGVAIEEILLLAECSLDGEWEGQVRHLLDTCLPYHGPAAPRPPQWRMP